ncbi:MAG: hypothetical protein VX438_19410, partial [Planctomycetota bacterium]|nr:hypothetical protein [Planctomycetota bacterium]
KISLADLLKPSIEQAMHGTLPDDKRAELERLLFSFWQTKLQITEDKPSAILRRIRHHPESGPLMQQIETWLHAPAASDQEINLAELLAPYQKYDAQELESLDLQNQGESPGAAS